MAAGDVKTVYFTDVVLDVTNLHSLAASATYIAGWQSPFIDHGTGGAHGEGVDNDTITLYLVTHASNRQAGFIRVYGVPMLDEATWPDVFDGTQSVETWTSVEHRDAAAFLAKEIAVNATASAAFPIIIPSMKAVFGGLLPKKYELWVTGNAATSTNAQLAASGSIVTVRSTYKNVAP